MRGFTLIELIVVMGIALLVIGVASTAFRRTNTTQTLASEGAKLLLELRRSQTNSFTGTKPATGCTNLYGYELELTATSYRVRPDCGPTPFPWSDPFVKTTTLPSSISLVTNPTPLSRNLRFKVLAQGVDIPNNASSLKICLVDVGSGKKYEVIITFTGEIRDNGVLSVITC